MKQLKKNTENYYQNIIKGKSKENMYTTFEDYRSQIRGKGYTKGFVPCNSRATNEYKDKTNCAYLINRYYKPTINNFFTDKGVKIDEDIWVRYLLEDISKYPSCREMDIVVSDVRQENEVRTLRREGYTIIKVTASENIRIARMKAAGDIVTKEQLSDETELSVDAIGADWVIVNEGTLEELTKVVEDIVAKIETGRTNK